MPFHVAQELDTMEGDEETRKMKILRAFLMADIHARKVGIISSGAAVVICLIQVRWGKGERVIAYVFSGAGVLQSASYFSHSHPHSFPCFVFLFCFSSLGGENSGLQFYQADFV